MGGRAGDDSHSPIRFEYWWVAGCVWTAAILYFSLRSAVAADVRIWLLPWYSHILEAGRWAAFAEPFGNYTPPYLYILVFFSNLSPWLPAIAALKIMRTPSALMTPVRPEGKGGSSAEPSLRRGIYNISSEIGLGASRS